MTALLRRLTAVVVVVVVVEASVVLGSALPTAWYFADFIMKK